LFEGIFTALITPMKNGNIDYDGLKRMVDFQLEADLQGLAICATTGEGSSLRSDERHGFIDAVIKQVDGRVKVIVGTGRVATWATIETSQVAADLGADATLVVSPAYILPSQDGIAQHYEEVADKSGLPVIAYNVPSRTKSDILPATLTRLSKHENLVGIKEASGSILRIQQVVTAVQGRMAVLAGDDPITLSLLVAGGQGAISTAANVVPKQWVGLWNAWKSGNIEQASAMQAGLTGLHEALFAETNPGPVKAAAHLLGLIEPEIRSPLTWPHKETLLKVQRELRAFNPELREVP
jgi:4-hydroxy-tetrahydrodipicolinate synthase